MEEMKEDIEFIDLGLPSGTLWAILSKLIAT